MTGGLCGETCTVSTLTASTTLPSYSKRTGRITWSRMPHWPMRTRTRHKRTRQSTRTDTSHETRSRAVTLEELDQVEQEEDGHAYRVAGWDGIAWRYLGRETRPDEDTEWTGIGEETGMADMV